MLSNYSQKKKKRRRSTRGHTRSFKRMNNWVIEELTSKTLSITAGMNTIKSKGLSITVQ